MCPLDLIKKKKKILLLGFFYSAVLFHICLVCLPLLLLAGALPLSVFSPLLSSCLYARRGVPTH